MVEIIAKKGDITVERTDAIVNPANSYGVMGGGVAYAIKRVGGQEIEDEAVENSPILVGTAIATTAGKLPSKFVIHAPTMREPAMRISVENVKKATRAALECACKNKLKSIAFPGMGTGVGGVDKKEAANAMAETIKSFLKEKETTLSNIILIGYDDELFKEFEKALREH